MRAKNAVISFRPSDKNKIYLERLGFIDGRSGKVRKDPTEPMAKFLNELITMMCESGMIRKTGKVIESDQLIESWIKYKINNKQKEIYKLGDEIEKLSKQRPSRKKLEKVMI